MKKTGTKTTAASKGRSYKIVRTYSAGAFAGELESQKGKEVVLTNARRLWQWKGAQTLSCLAVAGTSKPAECKFPAPVPRITLTEAIEVIDCTEAARKSLEAVPTWTA